MRSKNGFHRLVLILVVSLGAMALGGTLAARVGTGDQDFYAPLETFSQVLYRVQHNYVEDRPAEELMEGAIEGMLSTLDPFSLYLNPEEYKAFQEDTRGQYYGIGVQIQEGEGALDVVLAFPGQPAAKAGIESGDRIVSVDDISISDMGADVAISYIRGRKGTIVRLTVVKVDGTIRENVEVMRDEIHTPAVQAQLLRETTKTIGYVRLNQFQDGCAADVRDAVKSIIPEDRPLDGLVMDLRNNPGGLLDEAIKLVDLFVDSGIIVSTKGRTEEDIENARTSGTLDHTPMVVLVDEGSASASEIVAGALQDLERATVMGLPSYGKGSVQNIFPLADQSALRLTVAKYYTPNGRPIDRVNPVTPDIEVEPILENGDVQPYVDLDWLLGAELAEALSGDVQVNAAIQHLQDEPSPSQE